MRIMFYAPVRTSLKSMTLALFLLLVLGIILPDSAPAFSWTGKYSTPREEFNEAFAVFVGRVKSIEKMRPKRANEWHRNRVSFQVSKRFKGTVKQNMIIWTRDTRSMGGFRFRAGEEYLVYAQRVRGVANGPLRTDVTIRNGSTDKPSVQQEIQLVGGYASSAPRGADKAMELELPLIIRDFEDGAIGSEDQTIPTDFERAFRVYNLNILRLKRLNHEYDKEAIDSILQGGDLWVYPLVDETGKVVSSAEFRSGSRGWGVSEVPTYLNVEAIEHSIDETATKEDVAATHGLDDVEDIKHVHVGLGPYLLDLLYFISSGEPYFMTFSNNFYGLELENKKVYPAAEVLDKIAAQVADPPSGVRLGSDPIALLLAAAFGGLVVSGFALLLRRKRRIGKT